MYAFLCELLVNFPGKKGDRLKKDKFSSFSIVFNDDYPTAYCTSAGFYTQNQQSTLCPKSIAKITLLSSCETA